MRLIKAIFVGAISLFIIVTLFSLLIPARVMVSRATVINNVNAADVYRQLAILENWKNWHPIFTIGAAKLNRQPSTDDTQDSVWHIIHGQQDILLNLQSHDSTSVKFLLQVAGENDIQNDIVITPLQGQSNVQVEWRAITRLHWYPWEKFYGIFIDQLSGPGYEASLKSLKTFLEKE